MKFRMEVPGRRWNLELPANRRLIHGGFSLIYALFMLTHNIWKTSLKEITLMLKGRRASISYNVSTHIAPVVQFSGFPDVL